MENAVWRKCARRRSPVDTIAKLDVSGIIENACGSRCNARQIVSIASRKVVVGEEAFKRTDEDVGDVVIDVWSKRLDLFHVCRYSDPVLSKLSSIIS